MRAKRRLHPHYLFVAGLVGVLAGLVWAKFGGSASFSLVIVCLGLLPVVIERRLLAIAVVATIGLVLGLERGSQIYQQLQSYQLYYGQKVIVYGVVIDDPAYSDKGQLEFYIKDVELEGRRLPGKIRVRGFGNVTRRGELVAVTGTLRSGFGSYQGAIYYAQMEVLAYQTNTFQEWRSKFTHVIYSTMPDIEAGLGLGFLVGQRASLPEHLLNNLTTTGLMHIVAVSGYNLTILIRLTRRLFTRFSKFTAAFGAISLLVSFLLVTGFSPSVSRAAIVAGLALAGWYYGRPASPLVIILVSAAITAFVNPFYLWFDLGWYLSFLAFAGVLILAPLLQNKILRHKPGFVAQMLLETISAQALTLPLIVAVFGELSVISIVANLLVLPLIPLAMLTTFIAGVAGMASLALVQWLAWPAQQLLTFTIDIMSLLARPDWALMHVELSWPGMIMIYSLLGWIIILWRGSSERLKAQTMIE